MQHAKSKNAGALLPWLAVAVLVPLTFLLLGGADIVRDAAGIGKTSSGLSNLVSTANKLMKPAMVAMAAITPLACIVGAGALLVGNRRGLTIIGAALGTLIFVASITGIVS